MFQITVLLLGLGTCYANVPVIPDRTPPPPVRCGYMPTALLPCLGNPTIFKSDSTRSCSKSTTQCDQLTCLFQSQGWLDGTTVVKSKVEEYFNSYVKAHPEWTAAVDHAKATCLADNLPAQGYLLNCPAYDILTCTLAAFIKKAQPSSWSASSTCEYSRAYAAACPVCPQECFVPAIPIGSCNACRTY